MADEDKTAPEAATGEGVAAEPASNPTIPQSAAIAPPTPLPYPGRFEYCVRYMDKFCPEDAFPNEDLLVLYALKQQATVGPINIPKPSMWTGDAEETAKWNCWNELGKMDKMEAMRLYVKAVESEKPDWQTTPGLFEEDDDDDDNDNDDDNDKAVDLPATEEKTTNASTDMPPPTPHAQPSLPVPSTPVGGAGGAPGGDGALAHVTGGIPPPLSTSESNYRRPTVQRVLNQSASKRGNRPGVLVDANARLADLEQKYSQQQSELQRERLTRIEYENELVELRERYLGVVNENTQMRRELEKFAAWMQVYPNGTDGGLSWNPLDWISYIFSIGGRSEERESSAPPPTAQSQQYAAAAGVPPPQYSNPANGYNGYPTTAPGGPPPPGTPAQLNWPPPPPHGGTGTGGRYEATIDIRVDGDNAV